MKKGVDKILKFHWLKLVLLLVLIGLIYLFIYISMINYVRCISGSYLKNSSEITFYYSGNFRCYSYENSKKTNRVLCTNEECLDLMYDSPLYCENIDCISANSFSSSMFSRAIILSIISLIYLIYLITTIIYSSIHFLRKNQKRILINN